MPRQISIMISSSRKVNKYDQALALKCCQSPISTQCQHSNSILYLHIQQSKRPSFGIQLRGVALFRSIHWTIHLKWTYFTDPEQRQGETMVPGCYSKSSSKQILHSKGMCTDHFLGIFRDELSKTKNYQPATIFSSEFYRIGSEQYLQYGFIDKKRASNKVMRWEEGWVLGLHEMD